MNQSPLNRFYPFWLWLLTIGITPIGLFIWQTLLGSYTDNGSEITIIMLFIPFGFFFSAPAFFVTFLLYQSIRKLTIPLWFAKVITISIAIVSMVITLNIIDGSTIPTLKSAYGLAIALIGLLLKAKVNISSSDSDTIKLL
jgi:hypothetical protein